MDFLDASTHLYNRVCPSVDLSVGPLVRWSVRRSTRSVLPLVRFFSNTRKRVFLTSEGEGMPREGRRRKGEGAGEGPWERVARGKDAFNA